MGRRRCLLASADGGMLFVDVGDSDPGERRAAVEALLERLEQVVAAQTPA